MHEEKKIIFILMGFALSLALKQRLRATRTEMVY